MKTIKNYKLTIMQAVKMLIASLILFSFTGSINAQESNLLLSTNNKTSAAISLKKLLAVADSLSQDSLTISVSDLQLNSIGVDPFVDIYYIVHVKLFTGNKNVDLAVLTENLALTTKVNLEGELPGGGTYQHTETKELEVSARKDISEMLFHIAPDNYSPYKASVLEEVNIAIATSQLAAINTEAYLTNVYVEVFVERGRYFKPSNIGISPQFYASTNYDLKENEAVIKWDRVAAPSTYEVEWLHVPYDTTNGVDSVSFNFTKNTVRLFTDKDFIPVTKLYNNGFIIARGRTKRPLLNNAETALTENYTYSDWSLSNEGTISVNASEVLTINNSLEHEVNAINWQYRSSYASEGKKKEVVQFFDGSSRGRQSSTILYNNNKTRTVDAGVTVDNDITVISQEGYYDFNGTPIINILPSPLVSSNNVAYQKGINQKDTTKISKYLYDSLNYSPNLALTSDSAGAAQYYSSNNPLLGVDSNINFIPDAEGYPYQRTELMSDGSGRVKAVYGLGADKATDATKGTQYAYVKPTTAELERIFGSNVGQKEFYKKDVVIDPNGVMSIQYKDIKDRTVATALIGDAAGRSNMINLPNDSVVMQENLLTSGAELFLEEENAYELSYPTYVAVSSEYKFDYGFDVDPYLPCMSSPICFDCRYKLTFQIVDEDNNLILFITDSLVEFNQSNCLTESYQVDSINYVDTGYVATVESGVIAITLAARKQYTIYKRLELIQDSLEVDAEAYLQSQNCGIKDYLYFERNELDHTDFSQCTEDYSKEEYYFCQDIYEGLIEDFLYPSGLFFGGANQNGNATDILSTLYDSLSQTIGCNRFDVIGCFNDKQAFIDEMIGQFSFQGQHGTISAANARGLAEQLLPYHPNYCQYLVCQEKFSNYQAFDDVLSKSNDLDDFVALGSKQQLFDTDSFNFSWDTTLSTYIAIHTASGDTLQTEELFYRFDPVLRYESGKVADSIERYDLCTVGKKDGYGYYSMIAFNEFVRKGCVSNLDTFNRADIYNLYFNYLSNGCHPDTLPGDTGVAISLQLLVQAANLSTVNLEEEGVPNQRWAVFKNFYLSTREVLIQDMLSSLICVNPNNYEIDGNCSNKTKIEPYFDTTFVGMDILNIDTIMNTGCVAINLGCKDDLKKHFWETSHFTVVPRQMKDSSIYQNLTVTAGDSSAIDTIIGKQVYALLMFDSCISVADSAHLVSTFSAAEFVCEPYEYIDRNFGSDISCEVKRINLASIQTDLLRLRDQDTSNNLVSKFACDSIYQDDYTYQELLLRHNDFVASIEDTLPLVPSDSVLDITNSLQKKYANVMNGYLGLSLGFADYYYFFRDNTLDSAVNAFGDTVIWTDSARVKELKEIVIENTDSVRYKDLEVDSLYNLINKHLLVKGYDTLNRDSSYFGFGEPNFANGQNDLYFFENGKKTYAAVLDTFNAVFTAVKENLLILENGNGTIGASPLFIGQYDTIAGMNDVLLDRAVSYASGTVWVRTLNAADSSYFEDYYFHYEPFSCFYDIRDIDTFALIEPIFDQEAMHYVSLGFTFNNRDYEMVANSSRQLGAANRIAKVIFAPGGGEPNYPREETCEDLLYDYAIVRAKTKYNNYIQGIKDTFKLNYTNFCINKSTEMGADKAISNRQLVMDYALRDRHYTLYYYDQADNLVMTVPPAGVDTAFTYNATQESLISNHRNGIGNAILPQHERTTTYKYNSENQIVAQTTPNGGTSYFWYDIASRLVLSQNEEQRIANEFSYSRYDEQSRIYESGEVILNELSGKSQGDIHAFIIVEVLDSAVMTLDSLLHQNKRNDVTRTFYDEAVLSPPTGFSQNNLRKRVATQAYYHWFDSTTVQTEWEYATHFSYDPVGNVKSLLNDYYQLGTLTNEYQRYKRIDYAYDVISGNVQQVYYQTGRDDAFYHRYEYDAENRIVSTESSRDGLLWDEDATYDYYLHGPLARTEIGEHKVQGMDYAYTLDGWLKSVNAAHKGEDMGKDAARDNVFAADAFGMALQYNQNDFESIGATNDFLINGNTGAANSDLYNGNISAMVMHHADTTYGKEYQYDQLNRIRSMGERNIDESLLAWGGSLSGGNSSYYEYDGNGNLTNLQRRDSGMVMDQFSYNYISGTDKLGFVNDTVAASDFSNDIDNQNTGNYSYDKIGNLVSDSAENICDIRWYPNGKVKQVVRDNPIKGKSNLYFEYDGFGNRVKKVASFVEDGRLFRRATYYVRDASGNVMATYEERDCDFYESEDSLGTFYYQYGETYNHYTAEAITQESFASLMSLLDSSAFSKKEELCEQAYLNLTQITGIRDSILQHLNVSNYLALYPSAYQNVLDYDPYTYADYLYTEDSTSFIDIVNDRNEAYRQFLLENELEQNFYSKIDTLYELANGKDSNALKFIAVNKNIIADNLTDTTAITSLLSLTTSEYNSLINCYNNHETAISSLQSLMEDLNDRLSANLDDATTWDLIEQISAKLLSITYTNEEIGTVLTNVDESTILSGLASLSGPYNNGLNAVLHQMHLINAAYFDPSSLNDYTPGVSLDWTYDSSGSYLDYWLHTQEADSTVYNTMLTYFTTYSYDIVERSTAFTNTATVHTYVKEALLRNWNNTNVQDAVVTQDSITKVNLYATESLASLTNYFRIYHCDQVLLQNFYLDSLEMALTGINHYTPYDYGRELETHLGISITLGGCSPHSVYLLPEQFSVYGSSRLGLMTADETRKDEDNLYSRKLGAKNYELSDHLGNVVATISDKKLHPQDLLINGQYNVDSTIGFQPDVIARFDYYPFGMEMMSRSGSFSEVDYTTNSSNLIYDGLLDSCHRFTINGDLILCSQEENVYGESYATSIRGGTFDFTGFNIYIDAPLDQLITSVEDSTEYQIQILAINAGYRGVEGTVEGDTATISSPSAGAGASSAQINDAIDKLFTWNLTGSELQTIANANNGKITFDLDIEEIYQTGGNRAITLNWIRVSKVEENTTVPLAMRTDKGYRYGFNGMERDDEMKGSGNSYTTHYRQNDVRLGRWMSTDPAYLPWQSSYVSMNNNPILNIDPRGDIIRGSRAQRRAFKRREKAAGTWAQSKALYKGKNSPRHLSLTSKRNDPRVTQDINNAPIQTQTLRGAGANDNVDHIYHTPLTKTKTKTFKFDNIDNGGYLIDRPVVIRPYNPIIIGNDLTNRKHGSINNYLSNNPNLGFVIDLKNVILNHDDVNQTNPAQTSFNLNGNPLDFGLGTNNTLTTGRMNVKYNFNSGSIPLNLTDRINATEIRRAVGNRTDECHGHIIRVRVSITQFKKRRRNRNNSRRK